MTTRVLSLSTRPVRWLLGALILPIASGCSVVSKIDYTHLLTRQGWQRTDRVMEILDVRRGDHVADLGAGTGYFFARAINFVGGGYSRGG